MGRRTVTAAPSLLDITAPAAGQEQRVADGNLAGTAQVAPFVFDDVETVEVRGKLFCLTGDFRNEARETLAKAISAKRGFLSDSVTKAVDYVIVGDFGTSEHEPGDCGSKVEKALAFRRRGSRVLIVREHAIRDALNRKRPKTPRSAPSITEQVHDGLIAQEEARAVAVEQQTGEPEKRRRIPLPVVRPGPEGLCGNADYLLLVTAYDYDLSDVAFQEYCRYRGVLHVAGVPRSRRWEVFANHQIMKAEYLADDYFQFAQEHEGHRRRYTDADMQTLWKVILLGRAALQDCWELYQPQRSKPALL